MRPLLIGSLCSGYGGLDLGVGQAYGAQHAWHAEIDPDASKVLAAHWPDVPNHGDLRAVDWSAVEPVDILTAGFPCQPVSLAGRRRGLDDERWLFDDIADAISDLASRPRMLVLENVPGLRTANRGRAMGRLIYRLAALGYVGRFRPVRASHVGAAHRRERWFCVARLATDTTGLGHGDTGKTRRGGVSAAPVAGGVGADGLTLFPTPTKHDGISGAGGNRQGGPALRTAVTLLPTPRATDGIKGSPNQHGSSGDLMLPSAVMQLSPPTGTGRWGRYGPAIAHWERVTGRPAPDPTQTGRHGKPVLAPRLVEWLMGLPPGWVTDHLPRLPALRVLGNGVVPAQAALAVALLTTTEGAQPDGHAGIPQLGVGR